MQIHDLKPKTKLDRKKPRVGRGGKRGTTAGHGTKGQKSRAGHRIRPAVRDLLQRLPKLRGYDNPRKTPINQVLNLADLSRVKAKEINRAVLMKAGIIKSAGDAVKILGDGEIKEAVTISGIPVSKSAKEKIEKAGGRVIH